MAWICSTSRFNLIIIYLYHIYEYSPISIYLYYLSFSNRAKNYIKITKQVSEEYIYILRAAGEIE